MVHSVREHLRRLRLFINYHLIGLHISLLKRLMKVAASKPSAKTSTTVPKGFAASLASISRLTQWLAPTNASRRRLPIVSMLIAWATDLKPAATDGSTEDAARSKPHPDLFLAAAARIGVDPADCVVLEDSPRGKEAADAAGMACILVEPA